MVLEGKLNIGLKQGSFNVDNTCKTTIPCYVIVITT